MLIPLELLKKLIDELPDPRTYPWNYYRWDVEELGIKRKFDDEPFVISFIKDEDGENWCLLL